MLKLIDEDGFPHSEICGSKVAHTSPQLIAACHVLHRLCMPRHPPNALTSRLRVHTTNDSAGTTIKDRRPLGVHCPAIVRIILNLSLFNLVTVTSFLAKKRNRHGIDFRTHLQCQIGAIPPYSRDPKATRNSCLHLWNVAIIAHIAL